MGLALSVSAGDAVHRAILSDFLDSLMILSDITKSLRANFAKVAGILPTVNEFWCFESIGHMATASSRLSYRVCALDSPCSQNLVRSLRGR